MLDGKTMNTQCSIYYLHKYIDKLIEDGSRIICIFANNVKSNKPLDSNVEEKNKYYNSRYNNYYRQYKSNKIDEDMFNRIKIKLKELKENCNAVEATSESNRVNEPTSMSQRSDWFS